MTLTTKDEFKNESGGKLGVVLINPTDGKSYATHVEPDDTVWMSQDEQILTANAPKKPENNPFVNGSLVLKTEAKEVGNRRPIGRPGVPSEESVSETPPAPPEPPLATPEQEAEKAAQEAANEAKVADQPTPPEEETADVAPAPTETAAAPTPTAPPIEGQRAAGEEAGTPVERAQQVAPTARQSVQAGPAGAPPAPPQSPQGVPQPERAPDPLVR